MLNKFLKKPKNIKKNIRNLDKDNRNKRIKHLNSQKMIKNKFKYNLYILYIL